MLNKFSNAPHLVADLETLGTEPSAVIVRAAVVLVAKDNGLWGVMPVVDADLRMSVTDQLIAGRTCSRGTLGWWGQPEQTPALAHLGDSTEDFCPWVDEAQQKLAGKLAKFPNAFLWGMGSTFDCGILQSFLGSKMPIPFYRHMCLRTLIDFTGTERVRPKIPHVAREDAMAQAETLIKIFKAQGL